MPPMRTVINRLLPLALLCLPLLAGCMAVLGYNPTPEELEAIKRGEDPRARERHPAKDGTRADGGKGVEKPPEVPKDQQPGPATATILRWTSSATLTVEAEGRLMVVALPGVDTPADFAAAERARMNAEDAFPYGTAIRLSYPVKDKAGKTIYRDADDRLLAEIKKDVP